MSNTKHVVDNLSAYLDGRLRAGERALVEAHLSACPSCQAELASLQYVVAMTRSLPILRAPRSFTLSNEMAARARPLWKLSWIYASLRGFTALAALLLVLVCSADFLAFNRPAGFGAAAPAPAAMSVPNSTRTTLEASDQRQNQSRASASATVAASGAPAGAAVSAPSPVPSASVFTPAPAPAQAAQPTPTYAAQAPRAADASTSAPAPTSHSPVGSPSAPVFVTQTGPTAPAPTPSVALMVTVTSAPTLPAVVVLPPTAGFIEASTLRVAEIGLLSALILGILAILVLRTARR